MFEDKEIETLYQKLSAEIIPIVIHALPGGTYYLDESSSYPDRAIFSNRKHRAISDSITSYIEDNDELCNNLEQLANTLNSIFFQFIGRIEREINYLLEQLPGNVMIEIENLDFDYDLEIPRCKIVFDAIISLKIVENYLLVGFYAGAYDIEEYYFDDVEADEEFDELLTSYREQSKKDNEEWEIYLECEYPIPTWEFLDDNDRFNEELSRDELRHARKDDD